PTLDQFTRPRLRTGNKPVAFGPARPGKLKSRAECVAIVASRAHGIDEPALGRRSRKEDHSLLHRRPSRAAQNPTSGIAFGKDAHKLEQMPQSHSHNEMPRLMARDWE